MESKCRFGGQHRVKNLRNSHSRPSRVNPRLVKEILMLSITVKSSRPNNLLPVVYQVRTIYTPRLPHYMVSASIGAFPTSMRAKTIMLDGGSGCIIVFRSELLLGWHRPMYLEYEIPPVGHTNQNLLKISSSAIVRIKFGRAVNKTIFGC